MILLNYNNKKVQGIVDRNKINIVSTEGIQGAYDQYNFIIPTLGNKVSLNHEIVWDGIVYTVLSIDTTKNDLFYVTGKQKDVYNPHVYEIVLSSNSETLVEGGTYQISATCKDNGTVVTNPTLTYLSSDNTIATIDDKGLVNGVKTGTCNITVNYNNTIATLSLIINAKPIDPVISYSSTSSNGYSYRVKEGATLTYTKTIDSVVDNTLDVLFTLDATGTLLVNSNSISVVKKTGNTIQVRNLTITAPKSFVLTVKDSANGTVISTQIISTRSA
ncbi:bacterial Ig-like domain protein [Clostridium puniceum]|uniref:Bacterial Ig-like domain protein n=1 Tax=Clostridium puniceum TaxID=29367 RepID=A0A1S8TPD9_9CLOT|nr:bacterial Ig-like domain protein [Clostridium puniceum]